MELSTPALLFGSISLMLLAQTNRFAVIARLVRELHDRSQQGSTELILKQIPTLRRRLHLIKHTQSLGFASFMTCTGSMLAVFLEHVPLAYTLFGASVLLLLLSLLFGLVEVIQSTVALDMILDDCVRHSEDPE